MKRYAVWNKKDPILTPIGEVLTAKQWIERYPVAGIESVTVICGAGEINGAYFGTLNQKKPLLCDQTRQGRFTMHNISFEVCFS